MVCLKKLREEIAFLVMECKNLISDINKFDKDEFLKLTNLILENEWQKIKREARGKK